VYVHRVEALLQYLPYYNVHSGHRKQFQIRRVDETSNRQERVKVMIITIIQLGGLLEQYCNLLLFVVYRTGSPVREQPTAPRRALTRGSRMQCRT
jgi:hypothetical protein